jgi:RNA polymerase sigma-54 factor
MQQPRLDLRLSQRLVLTPTLQQAIKLLQYSRQELVQYIRQELLENPTLEEVQAEPIGPPLETAAAPSATAAPEPEPSPDGDDESWARYLESYDESYEQRAGAGEEAPEYESALSSAESLAEHLQRQLHVAVATDEERLIGEEIIGNIDENGYLQAGVEEIAALLGVAAEAVLAVLRLVQGFDPPGVGARDVGECLAIQLEQRGAAGGLAERLVRQHLGDLEARRYKRIASVQKVSLDAVVAAARAISELEPHPGRVFAGERTQVIVPDITITKEGDDYEVSLVEDGLPQLRINAFYRRMYRSGRLAATDREFIEKKVNSARWLIKSILQRQETILKVTRSIVRFQREFFDRGIDYLRPLVLRTVAEDIQMHESTVSRVTSNMYAQTPQGLFELKFFFNSGIERAGGGASMASVSVQDLLQKIVVAEDPQRPLSDLEIVRRLHQEHGLDIARRTVAKYRGILRLPPANRRRRLF